MKQSKLSILVFLLFLLHGEGIAQNAVSTDTQDVEIRELSGVLRYDLIPMQPSAPPRPGDRSDEGMVRNKKSPLRAALYSAIVPGAGQYYSESYLTAAAFAAAEIGLWIVYGMYNSKGEQQTAEFESYADRHWSVVRYAEWIERYGSTLNPNATILRGTVISQNPNLAPWDRVDWAKLNRNEEAIGQKTGTGFTHRLPRRPEQQYYEVIGKYEQYTSGWSDSNVGVHDYLTNVSPQFRFYRDMRGRANDLFMVAGTAAGILVANHLFSALHAAWSAHTFNAEMSLEVKLRPIERQPGWAEFVPTAIFTLQF